MPTNLYNKLLFKLHSKNNVFMKSKDFKSGKSLTAQTLLFLTLLSLTFTPTPIKTNIPEIIGLYTFFDPDVIGIGQALKDKSWVENVYDNAGKENLANIVISRLWHKISENEQLKTTEIAPVCELTPEILGQIINYIRKYRLSDEQKRAEITLLRENISTQWFNQCQSYIKTKLSTQIKNNISRIINGIKEEAIKNNKQFEELKPQEAALIEQQKNLISEITILKQKRKTQKTPEKASELEKTKQLILEKENEQTNCVEKISLLTKLEKNKTSYEEKIKKLNLKLKEEELEKATVKETANIQNNTKQILIELENLSISPSFIPETTEALLWAFFEDKFTLDQEEKAQKNLSLCLMQIEGTQTKEEKTFKKYPTDERVKFKDEIISIRDNEKKIEEIINNYDQSNHANIEISRSNIVPPIVNAKSMIYERIGEKTEKFATCFEGALLDSLSFLFYNPKTKAYDLSLLPENAKQSNFFKKLIEKIFTIKNEETGKESLLNPQKINSIYQNWINFIEDKKLDLGIEYWSPKDSRDKDNYYNLYTSVENLIKILNATFNLGFDITIDPGHPEILEIKNFDIAVKDKSELSGIQPKDFWNKIFNFISNKLSLQNRTVQFSYQPNPEAAKKIFKISDNAIQISCSYGRVNIKSEYNNEYITELGLQINSSHAYTTCKERDLKGLGDLYSTYFENLIKNKVIDNNKLLTLYILLMNTEMATKTTLPLENIIFYCLPQKNANQKADILGLYILKNLFDDAEFNYSKEKFLDGLDSPAAQRLLSSIFNSNIAIKPYKLIKEITNKITDSCDAQNSIRSIFDSTEDITPFQNNINQLLPKITDFAHATDAIIAIFKSSKDITPFQNNINQLLPKITNSAHVTDAIIAIFNSDKDIIPFQNNINQLLPKITDSLDAAYAIKSIFNSDKDIIPFQNNINQLLPKITYSAHAAKAIKIILNSNKDENYDKNYIEKLSKMIVNSADALNAIISFFESNKDITKFNNIIKEIATKITSYSDVLSALRIIINSNKKIQNRESIINILNPSKASCTII